MSVFAVLVTGRDAGMSERDWRAGRGGSGVVGSAGGTTRGPRVVAEGTGQAKIIHRAAGSNRTVLSTLALVRQFVS